METSQFVKDRLIRIESKLSRFITEYAEDRDEINKRLEDIEQQLQDKQEPSDGS